MVITSEDYFKFINSDSYFSRKLSTVLYENTVVILGYSLGDTNLKAIISDYKGFSKSHVVGSNIFLISRSAIDQNVKDYYFHCYGIRVLDALEINIFFKNLNKEIPKAEKISENILKIHSESCV
ncbi:SIR2 family protein [Dickeya zeae]|uniref:SIR2 family protein n=1 Tax=Dickeya zeae TaxID=204042 RepID=UPI001F21F064|nr:SIR2 family protein [Dickeya zeae]